MILTQHKKCSNIRLTITLNVLIGGAKLNKNLLMEFRKSKNMTIDEIASIIKVSSSYYQKIETGQRNPSYNFIKKFKKKFREIDVDKIFFDS